MLQSLKRLALVALVLLSAVATADAALITVSETSTGGGTVVNDGTDDVRSTDGSAQGFALLMSSFGITNGNLVNDLALFSITGLITDSDNLATSANLNVLRLIGTLVGNPLPACPTCGTLNDVRVGSTLGFGAAGNTQNVLFAFDIVGSLSGNPWVGPAGLSSPQNVPIGPQTFVYFLTAAQINFIATRMTTLGYNVNQVRLGLAASAVGLVPPSGQTDVALAFDLEGPVPIPEPATLLLLGSGIAAAGLRRVRRRIAH